MNTQLNYPYESDNNLQSTLHSLPSPISPPVSLSLFTSLPLFVRSPLLSGYGWFNDCNRGVEVLDIIPLPVCQLSTSCHRGQLRR